MTTRNVDKDDLRVDVGSGKDGGKVVNDSVVSGAEDVLEDSALVEVVADAVEDVEKDKKSGK